MNFTLVYLGPALLTGLEGVRQKAQLNGEISGNRASARIEAEIATLGGGAKNVAGVLELMALFSESSAGRSWILSFLLTIVYF